MKFEKVSYEQFKKDYLKMDDHLRRYSFYWNSNAPIPTEEYIASIYKDIQLPTRSTKSSAGYDFRLPYNFDGLSSCCLLVTGIKCELDNDKVLMLYPRSSLGVKKGFRLTNTTGVVDADYYNNENNEGHIMFDFVASDYVGFHKGDKYMQGIIMQYFKVDEDDTNETRSGGFGSTNKGQ